MVTFYLSKMILVHEFVELYIAYSNSVCLIMLNMQDKLLAENACTFLGIDRLRYETTFK